MRRGGILKTLTSKLKINIKKLFLFKVQKQNCKKVLNLLNAQVHVKFSMVIATSRPIKKHRNCHFFAVV